MGSLAVHGGEEVTYAVFATLLSPFSRVIDEFVQSLVDLLDVPVLDEHATRTLA